MICCFDLKSSSCSPSLGCIYVCKNAQQLSDCYKRLVWTFFPYLLALLHTCYSQNLPRVLRKVSLLDKIIRIYKEVIAELKAAGASWIQFDEPTLVLDLESHQLEAFTKVYAELQSSLSGLNVLVETYFADVPVAAYKNSGIPRKAESDIEASGCSFTI